VLEAEMAVISKTTLAMLSKLIPRLATNHAGEVIATAEAIKRTLAGGGADLHDLCAALGTPPQRKSNRHPADQLGEVREQIRELQAKEDRLRKVLLNGDSLVGDDYAATIQKQSQSRLDTAEARKHFGDLLAPFVFKHEVVQVRLRRVA
jgi:hypothetical protein